MRTVCSCANCYLQQPSLSIWWSVLQALTLCCCCCWLVIEIRTNLSCGDLCLFTISWVKTQQGHCCRNSWTEIKVLPFQMRQNSPAICSKEAFVSLSSEIKARLSTRHKRVTIFWGEGSNEISLSFFKLALQPLKSCLSVSVSTCLLQCLLCCFSVCSGFNCL